jgi:hypothetical protein
MSPSASDGEPGEARKADPCHDLQSKGASTWSQSDFRALEEDIANVRAARTGGDADLAASRTVGHFSQDTSDRRTAMVSQLNALWNGGALYNVTSGSQLSEFKRLLVAWLENVLMSRKNSKL